MYDKQGYGWGDMNVNDIMSDPEHWQGNYEGRYQSARNTRRPNNDNSEGVFNGNRAQPYYTSNANFAGGIIVIMVLAAVLQLSRMHVHEGYEKRRIGHEQASLSLRDARNHAKTWGRHDMIEAFQQRREVNGNEYKDELENLGVSHGRR